MHSINTRLLLVATVVLVVFFGLTGLALDRAYRQSAQTAVKERLLAHIYGLIGLADVNESGRMQLPAAVPDTRFSSPGSGLYAQVNSHDTGYIWRSPSLVGLNLPFYRHLPSGQQRFALRQTANGEEVHVLGFGLRWETESGKVAEFTFNVAENLEGFYSQVTSFRKNLWGWLAAVSVLLLGVLVWILRWGLAPLRQVATDLEQIESGEHTALTGRYPGELTGLTNNINRLIANERANLKRYRDTLGDLAHSLKTPLSVVRSVCDNESRPDEMKSAVLEQVERMTTIVNYQLQRAVTSGHTTFAAPINPASIAERLISSLQKVYGERDITLNSRLDKQALFHGEEGDLMEVIGNLLDNAFKWCRSQVTISIEALGDGHATTQGVVIQVEDDGPGISADQAENVLKRGVRADSQVEGHGIGLSILKDIVEAYNGQIHIQSGDLGGARVKLTLPGR